MDVVILFQTTIPHSYCTIDCNMSAITQLRAQYKRKYTVYKLMYYICTDIL